MISVTSWRGKGGSRYAGRPRQGRGALRKCPETVQEAVREGGNPLRNPQAGALREAEREKEEEGPRGQEARIEENEENEPVTDGAQGTDTGGHEEGGQGEKLLGPFCFADDLGRDQEQGDRGAGGDWGRPGPESACHDGEATQGIDRPLPPGGQNRPCREGGGGDRRTRGVPAEGALGRRGRIPGARGDRGDRGEVPRRHGPYHEGVDAESGGTCRRQDRQRERSGTLSPSLEKKIPLFFANRENQFCHGFGAGEGGSVFHFLMKARSLSF